VICELARTDHHRFRVLEPDSDQTKALRALTRAREDLVGTRTALTNQLRAELDRFWPGPLACSAICTAGSRSRSSSATRARPTRAGWARRA
jgi:Transposase